MEFKTYAPIIIPTLNRYEHLKRLITSLLANAEAKYSELVIGLDYPPSEKYREGYENIKEYLHTVKGFGKLTILTTNTNLGPTGNEQKLRNYVISKGYTSYIFSEDDNVMAPSFLSYMNWALQYFKNDKQVLIISGFRRDVPLANYPNNVYKSIYYRPYGIGIWIEKDLKRQSRMCLDYIRNHVNCMPITSCFNVSKMKRASTELYFLRKRVVHGDFCTNRYLEDENMYCVVPVWPLVKNLGSGGSGLHGTNMELYNRELQKKLDPSPVFVPIIKNSNMCTVETQSADMQEKNICSSTSNFKRNLINNLINTYRFIQFVVYKISGRIIYYKDY